MFDEDYSVEKIGANFLFFKNRFVAKVISRIKLYKETYLHIYMNHDVLFI